MSKVLGLITARGGSKGIPGKNIKPLGGKALINWTVTAALESKTIDRVVLSTDDEEIARVAREGGAEVPFMRPAELAGDNSPHIDVVLHAITWLADNEDYHPDYVMLLQPTSPFRTAENIDSAVALAEEKGGDGVLSVVEAPSHPYIVKRIAEDGTLADFVETPKGYLQRQTMKPAYAINGAIYLTRTELIIEEKKLSTGRFYPYVMNEEQSIDIDTPFDLHLAELLIEDQKKLNK
jgi:CMP-N-acetylneuraminic acid synthetase